MSLRKISIIGRPNVGKSTLFNVLTRNATHPSESILSINAPHTTRDYHTHTFEDTILADTVGLEIDNLHDPSMQFIQESDLILYVIDGTIGLLAEDIKIIKKLSKKEVILLINKSDCKDFSLNYAGVKVEDVFGISANTGGGIYDLMQTLRLVSKGEEKKPMIALVGRCNSGKSTLFNRLLNYDRSTVSEIAGTTRDVVKEDVSIFDDDFRVCDMAGYEKNKSILHYLTEKKREQTRKRCSGIIYMVDATIGLTKEDKTNITQLSNENSFLFICVNKIDLVENLNRSAFNYLDLPVIFISAKYKGIASLYYKVQTLWAKARERIPTRVLNKFLASYEKKFFSQSGRYLFVKYLVQTDVNPIEIVAFARDRLDKNSLRVLRKDLIKAFSLNGVNILVESRVS